MSTINMQITLQHLKKDLWKGIPMSKESEKTYKQFIQKCKSTSVTYTPRGGGKWDESLGMGGGITLRDMKNELEKCAERDRRSGEKCGLLCQVRKRKK